MTKLEKFELNQEIINAKIYSTAESPLETGD